MLSAGPAAGRASASAATRRRCPGSSATRSSPTTTRSVYDEAIELIERDYYRKVDGGELLDKSLGAAVKSLDDRFSNYFSPKEYAAFQEATERPVRGRRA